MTADGGMKQITSVVKLPYSGERSESESVVKKEKKKNIKLS